MSSFIANQLPNPLTIAWPVVNVQIWSIAERRVHQAFEGHTLEIYGLSFSNDGRFLVSGSGDKTTRVWKLGTARAIVLVENEKDELVTSVAISPDGRLVAAGNLEPVVRIWDANSGRLIDRLKGHEDSVYSVAFTPDGKGLISGSLDKTAKHWDLSALLRALDRDTPLSEAVTGSYTSGRYISPESKNSNATRLS
jgi:glucose repression regulatory protein TUP1